MTMRAEDLRDALRDAADSTLAPDRRAARQGVRRRVRRHQTRRLLAIAAAAIVLLGVGVAIARHRDDASEHVVTGLDQVPKLVPTYVPDGLGLSRVVDLPYVAAPGAPPVHDTRSLLSIYATGSGGDALGGSSFAVTVTKLTAQMQGGSSQRVGDENIGPTAGGLRVASIVVAPGTIVGVWSRQLTDDELTALARSVVLDVDGISISRLDVPAGYRVVVSNRESGLYGSTTLVTSTSATGYVVGWATTGSVDADSRHLFLAVTRQDQADLDAIRWGIEDVSFADIDGHRAVLGSLPGGESTSSSSGDGPSVTTQGPRTWVLSWLRDDHTLVTLQAIGGLTDPGCRGDCTPASLQRVARSLQPVGDRQWQTFVAATTTTLLNPNCTSLPNGGGEVCSSSGTGVVIPPVDGPNGTGG
jgi:hypothetical protein